MWCSLNASCAWLVRHVLAWVASGPAGCRALHWEDMRLEFCLLSHHLTTLNYNPTYNTNACPGRSRRAGAAAVHARGQMGLALVCGAAVLRAEQARLLRCRRVQGGKATGGWHVPGGAAAVAVAAWSHG